MNAASVRQTYISGNRGRVLDFYEHRLTPWLFVAVDIAVLQCCVFLGYGLRLLFDDIVPIAVRIGPEQLMQISMGLLTLPVVNWYLSIYPGYCLGPVERLRRRTYSTMGVFISLIAWDNIAYRGNWSRGVLLSALLFALVLPYIPEVLLRTALAVKGWWGLPAVIIGAGETGVTVARILNREMDLGLVPIAFCDDNPAMWGRDIEGISVVGPMAHASALAANASVVIVAIPNLTHEHLNRFIAQVSYSRIILIPRLFGIETQWVSARDLGGFLGLEIRRHLYSRRNQILKRTLDITLSLPLIILTLPLVALFALWIKLVSNGPALYSQEREGREGRLIRVWKLRTMHANADELLRQHLHDNVNAREEWNRFFKLKKDPRVIPGIGRLLRRTSFDELPQLWNVLVGEMSLVGPRPFPHYHLSQFPEDFRSFRRRVMPGLTGFWQVSDRSNGDLLVQEKLDTYYIRNWSLWLDLYLIVRTARAVVFGTGAY
jgi:Undecaprenyl-phosphate galactose phosphotransferase WbaP